MKNLLDSQNKPRKFKLNWKLKLFIILFIALLVVAGANALWKRIDKFYDKHYFQRNKMITVILKRPIEIREREVEVKEMVKIIEKVPSPVDLKEPIEIYIFKKFGLENYRMAIALARAESHMNCNAIGINENSADLGVFQINTLWLKNYSLEKLATCEGNVDAAYEIWDNGDRILGNNKGSWNPWTTARSGAYLNYLQ